MWFLIVAAPLRRGQLRAHGGGGGRAVDAVVVRVGEGWVGVGRKKQGK